MRFPNWCCTDCHCVSISYTDTHRFCHSLSISLFLSLSILISLSLHIALAPYLSLSISLSLSLPLSIDCYWSVLRWSTLALYTLLGAVSVCVCVRACACVQRYIMCRMSCLRCKLVCFCTQKLWSVTLNYTPQSNGKRSYLQRNIGKTSSTMTVLKLLMIFLLLFFENVNENQ